MDILLAGLTGFLMGFALENTITAYVIFTVTGLIAAGVARFQPPGAERIYWLFAGLAILLFAASFFGLSLHRFWFILPIVFVLSYFTARLVRKIGRGLGRRA